MSIPKIIHYCWFGGTALPEEYENYINGWHEKLPDYKFIRWDESNSNLDIEFVKKAYAKKKYALVSDYIRLTALFKYGGIYLDTDIEVLKPFDSLLDYNFFVGYIFDCLLGTAVIGAEKDSPIIAKLITKYENTNDENYDSLIPNNHVFTDFFLGECWFELNGKNVQHDGIKIFNKYTFEQPTYKKTNYTIHHNRQSWVDNKPNCALSLWVKKIIGETTYKKITAVYSKIRSPYFSIYKKAKKSKNRKKNSKFI